MTVTYRNALGRPRVRDTRSRFLLARAQTAAHGSTADCVRMREITRQATADVTPAEPRETAVPEPSLPPGGLRIQVFPLDDA